MSQDTNQPAAATTTPAIRWINPNKKRKTLSNVGFKEDIIYQAHTLEQPGFLAYYPKSYVDKLQTEIKRLKDSAE